MNTIIIAECCQNHNGNQETLKRMIHEAADSGADYVKIQAIRSKDLSFRERFEKGEVDSDGTVKTIQRPYHDEMKRLVELDLTQDQELWFVNECRVAGIKAMTTLFTRTAVSEIKSMGYSAIKIASYDCSSLPLLLDVKKEWNNIFVSTGSTYDDEIQEAVNTLSGSDFELLHCVTIYPTPLEELHLNRINHLKTLTPKVGYSDHSKVATTGLWASKIALAMGASNIERHYTVLGESDTRDGPVSITPILLKELREFADFDNEKQWEIIKRDFPEWEITLGDANRTLSKSELLNRDYYRGRFVNKIERKEFYNWEEI